MKKGLIATLAVLVLVTGCRKVPKLENGKEKVVSYSDGGIAVDDLYDEMKSKYALSILLDMIDRDILDKKYKETNAEKDYIKEQKENAKAYYDYIYSSSYSTYEAYLKAAYNIDSEDGLDDIFRLSYRREQATKDYAKTLITDSEIKNYYNDEYIPEMEASHILITADYSDDATDEEKEKAEKEALKTAKEIIKKLNNGEDFAELAKQYSKDGSASKGGALGKFGHGTMVEEFEAAAYKLKVNEYTKEPVKTKFGYHIILKTKEYEKKSLDSVKDEIIETLSESKMDNDSTLNIKALIKLRDDNKVSFEDSTLKSQYETYKYNYE